MIRESENKPISSVHKSAICEVSSWHTRSEIKKEAETITGGQASLAACMMCNVFLVFQHSTVTSERDAIPTRRRHSVQFKNWYDIKFFSEFYGT